MDLPSCHYTMDLSSYVIIQWTYHPMSLYSGPTILSLYNGPTIPCHYTMDLPSCHYTMDLLSYVIIQWTYHPVIIQWTYYNMATSTVYATAWGCIQSLDCTTGLPLKLKLQHYNSILGLNQGNFLV